MSVLIFDLVSSLWYTISFTWLDERVRLINPLKILLIRMFLAVIFVAFKASEPLKKVKE